MIPSNKLKHKYEKSYYINNKQDSDRIALNFYRKVIFRYFEFNNFLDFGCGTGYLLQKIISQNNQLKCYGIDISKYALKKAKLNNNKCIFFKDTKKIKNDSIDLIVTLHVLEHIDDINLKKLFSEFRRITHAKSNLLIVVPCLNGLGHILKKKKWIGYVDKTHINLKNYNSWKYFFEKNYFKVVKTYSDGLWDIPYKINIFKIKYLRIFFLLFIQIITGKLILKKTEGESLIFFLKKNDK